MPSFYLQSIDSNGVTTTKSFDSNYIDEVVDNVDDFLRGTGFVYDELKLVKAFSSILNCFFDVFFSSVTG